MAHSIRFALITEADSREIWSKIFIYGVNLTDLGSVIYIYGDCSDEAYEKIKAICKEYGDVYE